MSNLPRLIFILAFGALALISTLWSTNPSTSLRGGIQYLSTIVCAVTAARLVRAEDFALGVLAGCSAVIAYSFAVGGYAYDFLDGTYAFVGAFGSKNQLGFYASVALILAIVITMSSNRRRLTRALAAAMLGVASLTLAMAHSATSFLTVGATLALAAGLVIARGFAPTSRAVTLGLLAGVVVIALILAAQSGAFDELLRLFGKDATLTGRTYLWREGLVAAEAHPFFGMGYQVFWTVGMARAEQLWEEFYIFNRSGFHFHNIYIETLVGLGLVGLGLLAALLLYLVFLCAKLTIASRLDVAGISCILISALLIARSVAEIDFLTPYTLGTFLIYYCLTMLVDAQKAVKLTAASRRLRAKPLLAADGAGSRAAA